jgi:hypothetical protein
MVFRLVVDRHGSSVPAAKRRYQAETKKNPTHRLHSKDGAIIAAANLPAAGGDLQAGKWRRPDTLS